MPKLAIDPSLVDRVQNDPLLRRFVLSYDKISPSDRSIVKRMAYCMLGEMTELQRARLIGDIKRRFVDDVPSRTVAALMRADVRRTRLSPSVRRARLDRRYVSSILADARRLQREAS